MFDEYRCKILQQNSSKPNLTAFKKNHTPDQGNDFSPSYKEYGIQPM